MRATFGALRVVDVPAESEHAGDAGYLIVGHAADGRLGGVYIAAAPFVPSSQGSAAQPHSPAPGPTPRGPAHSHHVAQRMPAVIQSGGLQQSGAAVAADSTDVDESQGTRMLCGQSGPGAYSARVRTEKAQTKEEEEEEEREREKAVRGAGYCEMPAGQREAHRKFDNDFTIRFDLDTGSSIFVDQLLSLFSYPVS